MAVLQKKFPRRYQRYISAHQLFDQKEDDPKEIWERITKMPDILSAMVIDRETNDLFPLYGLNNISRNDLNSYCREYIEMAIDFALNIDPSDEVKILRIRSEEREVVLAHDDDKTIFVIIQSLSKEKRTISSTFSLDL